MAIQVLLRWIKFLILCHYSLFRSDSFSLKHQYIDVVLYFLKNYRIKGFCLVLFFCCGDQAKKLFYSSKVMIIFLLICITLKWNVQQAHIGVFGCPHTFGHGALSVYTTVQKFGVRCFFFVLFFLFCKHRLNWTKVTVKTR